MTFFYFLIFLAVGIFNDFNLPDLEIWNAWTVVLFSTIAWDISSD